MPPGPNLFLVLWVACFQHCSGEQTGRNVHDFCSWAATNNSCLCKGGVYKKFNLNYIWSTGLILSNVFLVTWFVSTSHSFCFLCLVNRSSVRLIRVGQSTHNLQAVVTQEDNSSLLSPSCWGNVNCLTGGSARSWLPFWFLDLFYLLQPRGGLWWTVTGGTSHQPTSTVYRFPILAVLSVGKKRPRRAEEGGWEDTGNRVCCYPFSSTVSQLLWDVQPVVQRYWSVLH